MQTDERLEDYNVKTEVDGFVKFAQHVYGNTPQTNHIMCVLHSSHCAPRYRCLLYA